MFARMVRRSIVGNLRVAVWTLATLTTCAALAALFTSVAVDARRAMGASLRKLGANAVISLQDARSDGSTGDWAAAHAAAASGGARLCVLDAAVGTIEGKPVAVVAANPADLADLTRYWAVTGNRAERSSQCLVGRRLADALGLRAGNGVTVAWGGPADRSTALTVVGTFESGDEDEDRRFVPAPLPVAARLSYAMLSVPDGNAGIAAFSTRLVREAPGVEVRPLLQAVHGEGVVLGKLELLVGLALLAVTVLAGLGVSAAVLARVAERRSELALLQALGAGGRFIVTYLLTEAAAIGVAASLAGFALGGLMARLVMRQAFGVAVHPGIAALATALAVGVTVALLAGAGGARRALRMAPAAALKGE